jgi:hypothetical protein
MGLADLEAVDQRSQLIGLALQRVAGGGGFLDHGGVLLDDLVHLVHGDIDL